MTADAPFQVVSDGTHLVVLRQSVGAGHPDAVLVRTGGGSSGDASRTDYVRDAVGAKVPLVADTLLCDRFLLAEGELKPVLEVRYRRSRHRTRPHSAKDSLGTADMAGRPFHEPTQELSFVRNLSDGRFTALLVPTTVHGQQRWQIFAHNDATGRIDAFNVEQGKDGLFNTQGSQAWTSPDPRYRDTVYERGPGACPFTGQPLVPVAGADGYAGAAMSFDGAQDFAETRRDAPLAGGDFTVEFWVRRTEVGGRDDFAVGHGDPKGKSRQSLQIGFRSDNSFAFAFYKDDLKTTQKFTDADWHHWACVHERASRRQVVYRDGVEIERRTAGGAYAGTGILTLGKAIGRPGRMELDEVRIWNRARGGEELKREMGTSLIGNEPGLLAYYRFDEGDGDRLYDQTDNALNAELSGGLTWVASNAPVGDCPGLRRDSFAVAGRRVVSVLSAVLYHRQEQSPAGYGQESKPVKRQARVLLSCATAGPDPRTSAATEDAYLATVDFGVGRDGRLARIPGELKLPVLQRPEASEDAERISELDTRATRLARERGVPARGPVRAPLSDRGDRRRGPAVRPVRIAVSTPVSTGSRFAGRCPRPGATPRS